MSIRAMKWLLRFQLILAAHDLNLAHNVIITVIHEF